MKILNDRVYPETPLLELTRPEDKGYGIKTYSKIVGAFLASKPIAWLFGKTVKLVKIREDDAANDKEVYVNINSLAQYAFRKNLATPKAGSYDSGEKMGKSYMEYKKIYHYPRKEINDLKQMIVNANETENLNQIITKLRSKL